MINMNFFTHEICINDRRVPLRAYLPDIAPKAFLKSLRPALIIFPGGAYKKVYAGEAEPIALRFIARGICAFVLNYSIFPAPFPQALLEAFEAIRYVRSHAEEFGIDPNNVSVCGFSAGGHLAAMTGTVWNHPFLDGLLTGDRRQYRPDRMVLCYPAIRDRQSFLNLVEGDGSRLTPEFLNLLNTEKQVSKETPPAFLWHNFDDKTVPLETTLTFAAALYRLGIPVELRVYPSGGHGTCLGDHVTNQLEVGNPYPCTEWTEVAAAFLFRKI